MLISSQEAVNFREYSSCLGKIYVSEDQRFAAVFSASGAVIPADFVVGGLSFWGENSRSDLRCLYLVMAAP